MATPRVGEDYQRLIFLNAVEFRPEFHDCTMTNRQRSKGPLSGLHFRPAYVIEHQPSQLKVPLQPIRMLPTHTLDRSLDIRPSHWRQIEQRFSSLENTGKTALKWPPRELGDKIPNPTQLDSLFIFGQ